MDAEAVTPAAGGYRLPAEWESHEATWIGWPHNTSDWPGKFAPIPWVYGEIARSIAPGETVRALVESRTHEESARRVLTRAGVDAGRIEFLRFPTDRGWTRDSGPAFLVNSAGRPALACFGFNGWARYDDYRRDARLPDRIARALGLRAFKATLGGREVVLEGGAIDVNGAGTLCREENPADENHRPLEENRERLEGMRLENGAKLEVVFLPMPSPLFFDGRRLPASYANFYVANAAVLVPTFNDPKDREALGVLSEIFADRPVVGIHAVDLVWGLGTIHCLTRQQPGEKAP